MVSHNVETDVLMVDVDFIREEMQRDKKAIDYELLFRLFDSQVNIAYLGQNFSVDNIQPLEKFRTRLAIIGWNAYKYSFNRRAGDVPRPSGLMGFHLGRQISGRIQTVTIITGDRGIIPVIEAVRTPWRTFSVLGPESWTNDPVAIQVFSKIAVFSEFAEREHLTSGDGWTIDEEFQTS